MKIFKGITKYIIILILFSLLISYCNLQIAMYIRYAIDGILFHNLEEIPKFIQPIIEMDIIRSLIILSGIIMGIRGILVLVNYIRERITTKFTLKISANLKEALYAHILKLEYDSYYSYSKVEMLQRVNEDAKEYSNFFKVQFNVILDTDTYNECDDQFALAYMIKNQEIFNIEAITVAPYSHKERNETVISGQEKSYNEILKICNWLNFDTTNKVFKGAEDYFTNGYDETNDAVNKIIEVAQKNDKTYIMAIGAITNVALAIKKEPKIINKIEVVWLGGHSLLQKNNLEFNFRQDVNAVRIVFDSKVRLTIIPCKNVASNLKTSVYELNYYLKDKSELCNYLIDRFYNDGYHGIQERRVIWDISVIAYMINKKWFTSEDISCPNIKKDTSYELTTNNHKIKMVNYIDVKEVYNDLFKKLGK